MHFLEKILPSQGLYCSAQAVPGGGFIHKYFNSIDGLVEQIERQDRAGHTMYVAQATYKTPESRKTANASHLRNFFFDVDCGQAKFEQTPDKAYPTQRDGVDAIKAFAAEMGLPRPSIVVSGYGLYAHWAIDEDIEVDKWRSLAKILKEVATKAGFKQDPSRTSDASSVLRPVGTTNRKKAEERLVQLAYNAEPITLKTFTDALNAAAAKHKVLALPLQLPQQFKGLNDDFTSGITGPPSSIYRVADHCAQVRKVRDTLGNVDEPLWYAFLQLGNFTEEGKQIWILHEWSKGHPDYTSENTLKKINQLLKQPNIGPTTCERFGSENPTGCIGCEYANKIKTPLVLGREEAPSVATEEEEAVLPTGFKRTDQGMLFSEDGTVWHKFYPYDIYITSISFDSTLGYEVATVRHKLPISDTYAQFTVRSALMHDPKSMLMCLADNHVQTTGGEARKQMINYIDAAMAQMRAKRKLTDLHSQMGWHEIDGQQSFVLGEQLITKDAEQQTIGFAKNVPDAARAFCAKGELTIWKGGTKYLGLRGMEPFAVSFLAAAFGAPLFKFTGFAGALVALIGDSGIGKTVLGGLIMSVYGNPEKLVLLKDDTKNFLVQRLGLYGSLPLYVDEVSNIEGQDLSELVYKITQGRDKGRLGRSGQERAVINSWNTVALVSSNHSLIDKLSTLKADASAEINRIMEIEVSAIPEFGREEATAMRRAYTENYGVSGAIYLQYLADHQDQHRDKIDAIIKALDASTGSSPDERYWSALGGCMIYSGLIAKKLGLIDFEIAPLIPWIKQHILTAREVKSDSVVNYSDYLGQFLDANMRGVLVVTGVSGKEHQVSEKRLPTGNLVARLEDDTQRLFVSRAVLKEYLERHYGSYSKLKTTLEKCGALIDSNKRKVLGAGTIFSGSQQPVWEIDLTCRALGNRALHIVRKIEADAARKEASK